MSGYEDILNQRLDEINGFHHEDIIHLDRYPAEIADAVLGELLKWGCQSQNEANIVLGRKKVIEINQNWLLLHITGCAENYLDLSDEWEYRRFVELILLAVPDLMSWALALGDNSQNVEMKEVADDFRNQLS